MANCVYYNQCWKLLNSRKGLQTVNISNGRAEPSLQRLSPHQPPCHPCRLCHSVTRPPGQTRCRMWSTLPRILPRSHQHAVWSTQSQAHHGVLGGSHHSDTLGSAGWRCGEPAYKLRCTQRRCSQSWCPLQENESSLTSPGPKAHRHLQGQELTDSSRAKSSQTSPGLKVHWHLKG